MKKINKGIILAGGTGTRLYPLTISTSKQLIPIYDKPMIYYSLTTLMLADIRDILIITNPKHNKNFRDLLGDGKDLGMNFTYATQENPDGIAQSILIAEEFLEKQSVALILGDNIYYGSGLSEKLTSAAKQSEGATIFACRVKDPNRYGVVEFYSDGRAKSIEEKPTNPKSNYAVTGLYFFDKNAVNFAKGLKPSERGELEISSLIEVYLKEKNLKVELLDRGITWFDAGTIDSLHESSSFIQTLEHRQGMKVGCPEEIAWKKNWIDKNKLKVLASSMKNSSYGDYLNKLVSENLTSYF